jgi:hypothetical protein
MAKRPSHLERAQTATRESKFVDFKGHFDVTSDGEWCEIIKDVVAFANSGGGVILFGIADDGQMTGYDPTPLLAADPADITNKIARFTGVDFADFEIATVMRQGSEVAALLVEGALAPIPFTRPGTYDAGGGKQKTAFGRGTVYFRHGAKSEPATLHDMVAWRDKIIARARSDWLGGIRKVVTAPAGHTVTVVPATRGASAAGVVHGSLSAVSKGPKVAVQNAEEIWPLRRKDLLIEINRRIAPKQLSPHDIQCANWKLDVFNEHPEFAYKPHRMSAPQYSTTYADWLVEKSKDPAFFAGLREEHMAFYREHHPPKGKKPPRPRARLGTGPDV